MLIVILVIMLFPTISQLIAVNFQNYWIGLIIRILSHIIIPIIYILIVNKKKLTKESLIKSFKEPFMYKKEKQNIKHIFIGISLSLVIIMGAFYILKNLINFQDISNNLTNNLGITPIVYPFVALAIIIINSTIEEYFWRGFIFREINHLANKKNSRIIKLIAYGTGLMFALHHVLIIDGWFNWWQNLLVIVFLLIVGIYFNYIYEKTDSIYSTWAIHAFADLIIVLIGFFFVF